VPQGARTERVAEEFREILAEEVQRLKDPRLGFVTLTGVEVSGDLRHAWVYFTAMGDERERAGTRAALRSATKHLRHELGRQVRLKVTPEIEFREDRSAERGERIEAIIERIRRGSSPAPPDDAD
jgi:ribosome-binding factor A